MTVIVLCCFVCFLACEIQSVRSADRHLQTHPLLCPPGTLRNTNTMALPKHRPLETRSSTLSSRAPSASRTETTVRRLLSLCRWPSRNRCKPHVRITLTSWLHRSACVDAFHSFGRMRCMWPSSGNDRLRLERQCRRQRRQLQLELLRLCVFPRIMMCLKAPPWLLRWLHPQHEQTRRSFRKHATS